jgi:hypothetical protein
MKPAGRSFGLRHIIETDTGSLVPDHAYQSASDLDSVYAVVVARDRFMLAFDLVLHF